MKIGELRERLAFLQKHYGDIDCVVYPASGIERISQPRVHVLQDFDFGTLGEHKTGDRLVVIWSKV